MLRSGLRRTVSSCGGHWQLCARAACLRPGDWRQCGATLAGSSDSDRDCSGSCQWGRVVVPRGVCVLLSFLPVCHRVLSVLSAFKSLCPRAALQRLCVGSAGGGPPACLCCVPGPATACVLGVPESLSARMRGAIRKCVHCHWHCLMKPFVLSAMSSILKAASCYDKNIELVCQP
jgi:hypothetical protein